MKFIKTLIVCLLISGCSSNAVTIINKEDVIVSGLAVWNEGPYCTISMRDIDGTYSRIILLKDGRVGQSSYSWTYSYNEQGDKIWFEKNCQFTGDTK